MDSTNGMHSTTLGLSQICPQRAKNRKMLIPKTVHDILEQRVCLIHRTP